MKIKFRVNQQELEATLNSSNAAKDFYALLPLTVSLSDFAHEEKVCDLPGRLNVDDSPSGCSAKAGDITYYAPWGNLAIFYKGHGRASGLVNLGSFDSDISPLLGKNTHEVEILPA